MKFNINDTVRVRLTDHGRAVHKADHYTFWAKFGGQLRAPKYIPPVEDAEGWSKWQLWVLMNAFGSHLHIGFRRCFETEIELEIPCDTSELQGRIG